MEKPCKCEGMNEECLFCGGTGVIKDKEIQIIKTISDKNILKKQDSDLQSYLHTNPDKLYVSDNKSKLGKKKKPIFNKLGEIKKDAQLKFIGPNNPNRNKVGDTRKLGKQNKAKNSKTKKKEKHIDAKIKSGPELEFLLFWKNNVKGKTKDSQEFQDCLTLFLKLKISKREKFKHGIVTKNASKDADIGIVARDLYDKLTLLK